MVIETFRDIFSTIDYEIGVERLEKFRDYILKINLDKTLIHHVTNHINTMIESSKKLKEDCIELHKLLLHWCDDRYCDGDNPVSRDITQIYLISK